MTLAILMFPFRAVVDEGDVRVAGEQEDLVFISHEDLEGFSESDFAMARACCRASALAAGVPQLLRLAR
ncbi:MAG: hypothetical protein OXQ84_10425 [bacterium]|nr:hypothetical protein [bacterium]